MKKFARPILAVLCALVLLAALAIAEEGFVRFEGDAKKSVFLPGNAGSETSLFGKAFDEVMPGDVLKQDIKVVNHSGKMQRIFLRAEPVTEEDKALLNQMRLTVATSSRTIFDAPAGETAGLTENVLLGNFRKNGTVKLMITLTVPADMGNEFMGMTGIIPWTFSVEELDDIVTPKTGDWFQLTIWITLAVVLAAAAAYFLRRRMAAAK